MTPLDDELHAALAARALEIAPSPDPMAGIEQRARRLRRRRLAASLAGGAIVIAAVAVAVPSLLPGHPTVRLAPATAGPDVSASPTAEPTPSQFPANLLQTWPQRGTSTRPPSIDLLVRRFADGMGRSSDASLVRYRQLFVGDTGKGEAFTVGQAWFDADSQAYDVSYTTGVTSMRGPTSDEFFLGKPTPAHPVVLAFQVPNLAGMSDLLVVVPQPGTGQVLYSPSDTGAFQPITGQDRYDGVVLIDRASRASNDQLELLDGNGNMDRPTYKGPVMPLLCGLKSCG